MTQGIKLSKRLYENLLNHLINIEDSKSNIVQKYFWNNLNMKNEFEKMVGDYIKTIDQYIRSAVISDSPEKTDSLPFIIIGSQVTVKETSSDEIVNYIITSPFEESAPVHDTNCQEISYMSPMGKSLLFKKIGDHFTVNAPGGTFVYEVLNINYPAEKTGTA